MKNNKQTITLNDYKDYTVGVCGDGGAHFFYLKTFLLILREGNRWSWPNDEELKNTKDFKDITLRRYFYNTLKYDLDRGHRFYSEFPHGQLVLFYYDPFTGKEIPWNDILNQVNVETFNEETRFCVLNSYHNIEAKFKTNDEAENYIKSECKQNPELNEAKFTIVEYTLTKIKEYEQLIEKNKQKKECKFQEIGVCKAKSL